MNYHSCRIGKLSYIRILKARRFLANFHLNKELTDGMDVSLESAYYSHKVYFLNSPNPNLWGVLTNAGKYWIDPSKYSVLFRQIGITMNPSQKIEKGFVFSLLVPLSYSEMIAVSMQIDFQHLQKIKKEKLERIEMVTATERQAERIMKALKSSQLVAANVKAAFDHLDYKPLIQAVLVIISYALTYKQYPVLLLLYQTVVFFVVPASQDRCKTKFSFLTDPKYFATCCRTVFEVGVSTTIETVNWKYRNKLSRSLSANWLHGKSLHV